MVPTVTVLIWIPKRVVDLNWTPQKLVYPKRGVCQLVCLMTKKTFRWLLVANTTSSNELSKLELSWAWEHTNKKQACCLHWKKRSQTYFLDGNQG